MDRNWFTAAAAVVIAVVAQSAVKAGDQPPPTMVMKGPQATGGSFWIEAAALYWSAKGDRLPALVTQGGTGALGAPGTSVLFGDSTVNDGWRAGGRVRLGYWFDPGKRTGIDAHFFMLGRGATNFFASSAGSPLLARPFFNTFINAQDALLIASAAPQSGQISINDSTDLLGAGAAWRGELCATCALGSISGIAGYRYVRLGDDLRIASSVNNQFLGVAVAAHEQFKTTNEFHGLDVGVTGEIVRGPWKLEWLAKAAVGVTLTALSINGSTSTTFGGATVVSVGDLLALPTNIGRFTTSRFSVLPEVSAKLGYQISPALRAFVGYDVMYWTGVVRPGGAIDTTVNPTQLSGGALVGAARPTPQFNTSDFWVHGVNIGLNLAF